MGVAEASIDGRHARRERGRLAVIDAMFELLQSGEVPVSAELVAERSGVSVASVFRYFDGLDDLMFQTFERFWERFVPLLTVPDTVVARPRADRVRAFVAARLELYEHAGTIMAVGRLRALEHEQLVVASSEMRGLLADQVRQVFAVDTAAASRARTADLVAMIDAFTSLDAWDVMRRTHARSNAQIGRSWTRGIDALIQAWEHTPTSDRRGSG